MHQLNTAYVLQISPCANQVTRFTYCSNYVDNYLPRSQCCLFVICYSSVLQSDHGMHQFVCFSTEYWALDSQFIKSQKRLTIQITVSVSMASQSARNAGSPSALLRRKSYAIQMERILHLSSCTMHWRSTSGAGQALLFLWASWTRSALICIAVLWENATRPYRNCNNHAFTRLLSLKLVTAFFMRLVRNEYARS